MSNQLQVNLVVILACSWVKDWLSSLNNPKKKKERKGMMPLNIYLPIWTEQAWPIWDLLPLGC